MKKSFKIISALILSSTMAFGLGATIFATSNNITKTEAVYSPGTHYSVSDTASELASYYSSISSSDTGSTLLTQLQSLNSSKKRTSISYDNLGTTTASSPFVFTDYVLGSTSKNGHGQVYGTEVASFYTKTAATSWNREHTWPKSHGGNLIEGDILMTRPTISSENSDRGNSFYVEDKADGTYGWDPKTAGYAEWCRGECARIILYGCVANSNLNLIDADYHATSNNNRDNLMGNINTLIKWHFAYTPNQYEINRNNGAEYLQGNRNPFVDHPEYVAKIWSNFNNTVSSLCASNSSVYSNWVVGSCSTYGTNDAAGGSTNTDPAISIYASSTSVQVGKTITLTANKSNITGTVQWYVSDSSSNVVSLSATSGDSITVSGVSEGTKTIYAHIGTVSANVSITVTAASSIGDGDLITSNEDLSTGDKVVLKTQDSTPKGVTGWNNSSDATASTTESSWKQFTVKEVTSSGFKLYDEDSSKYIAQPTANEFKYSTSGGTCSVDSEGHIICNNRYLCVNGSNYRFYTTIQSSYSPFYVYLSGSSSTSKTLSSISVSTAPSKTTYTVGEHFDPTGLVIKATYSDNSTQNISYASNSSLFEFSPTTSTALTTSVTKVTITYGGKTCDQAITVNASQGGGSGTYTISYSDSFSPALPTTANSANTTDTAHTDTTANNFAFKEQSIYKGSSNNYLMFIENKGFMYNTTNLGTVTSVSVTYSSGTSTSGKIGVYFGSTAQSTYKTTSNQTIKGTSQTDTFENSTTGNGFFQISTSNKNVQITGIVVQYSSSGSSTASLSLNKSSESIAVNGTASITATASSGSGSVTWSSDDTSVATVSPTSGSSTTVTGVAAGTATITASYSGKTATCTITVTGGSTIQPEHAGTLEDPYTTADAKLVMDYMGSGVVYQTEVYVTMVPTSSSFDSQYSQYQCTDDNMTISSASLSFTPNGTYTDPDALVGKTVVAKGYIELYNSTYQMGYLPQTVSPTGSKYSPTIVSITPDTSGEQSEGVYTLLPATGNNSSYGASGDVAIDGVTWSVNGNNTLIPWRIGGKSISNEDRTVESTSAVSSQNISSVVLTVGTAESITVNSLTLYVGTAQGEDDVSTVTATFEANSDITFERPNGANWSNRYFTFVFNVTVSGSNNKFVQFTKAIFYANNSNDGATTFAQTFMGAFTCDSTGATAPAFASGKSWTTLKTAFNALDTADQNTLKNATANQSGTDIEKAMARYDYVVHKYGYENFINRTTGNGANVMKMFNTSSSNNILLVLGSLSLLGGLTYLAYFLKKRKED